MRTKVKSVEFINEIMQNSELKENNHTDILEHLKRNECPYCAARLLVKKDLINEIPVNTLYKSSCSLKEFNDSSGHIKPSCSVKNAIHLIFEYSNKKVQIIQDSGNTPDDYVFEDN